MTISSRVSTYPYPIQVKGFQYQRHFRFSSQGAYLFFNVNYSIEIHDVEAVEKYPRHVFECCTNLFKELSQITSVFHNKKMLLQFSYVTNETRYTEPAGIDTNWQFK